MKEEKKGQSERRLSDATKAKSKTDEEGGREGERWEREDSRRGT